MDRTGECNNCGECCQSLKITSVLSHSLKQHRSLEELKLYYRYHNTEVIGTDEQNDLLFLEVKVRCQQLDENNHCLVHDKPELKPFLCHIYPTEPDPTVNCGFQFERPKLF